MGLAGKSDPEVLEWAAREGRVVVTHDRNTLIGHAWERVRLGLRMPRRIIAVSTHLPIGHVIAELQLVAEASREDECEAMVLFISAS